MSKKIDIKEMVNARKARGMILLELGIEPKEVNPHTWIVPSQTGNGTYQVHVFQRHWKCTCPDFELRGVPCKHIACVKIWKQLKEKFEQLHLKVKHKLRVKDEPLLACKFCKSTNIMKYGKKNGKQNYMCKDCNRKFVDNIDFENMKYNPKIIALTLNLSLLFLSPFSILFNQEFRHLVKKTEIPFSINRWLKDKLSPTTTKFNITKMVFINCNYFPHISFSILWSFQFIECDIYLTHFYSTSFICNCNLDSLFLLSSMVSISHSSSSINLTRL